MVSGSVAFGASSSVRQHLLTILENRVGVCFLDLVLTESESHFRFLRGRFFPPGAFAAMLSSSARGRCIQLLLSSDSHY